MTLFHGLWVYFWKQQKKNWGWKLERCLIAPCDSWRIPENLSVCCYKFLNQPPPGLKLLKTKRRKEQTPKPSGAPVLAGEAPGYGYEKNPPAAGSNLCKMFFIGRPALRIQSAEIDEAYFDKYGYQSKYGSQCFIANTMTQTYRAVFLQLIYFDAPVMCGAICRSFESFYWLWAQFKVFKSSWAVSKGYITRFYMRLRKFLWKIFVSCWVDILIDEPSP